MVEFKYLAQLYASLNQGVSIGVLLDNRRL